LPITADLLTEGSETVIVTLGTPSVATDVVTAGAGTVTTTIADTSTTAVVSAFNLTASNNTSTNGIDNVSGTAYNSIVGFIDASAGTASATTSTWSLTDTIAPAASANAAINLTVLNTGATTAISGTVSLAGYATVNVPTFNLKVIDSSAATVNTTSFDVGAMTGLTTVKVASSSTITPTPTSNANDLVSLTSIPAAAQLSVSNNGQYTNVTGTWVSAATAGSADTVTLALEGRNGNITVGTGFETAAVTTTGTGNRDTGLVGSTFKTVTVAGTDFRVDSALDATVTSFSAANASGAINVALNSTATFTAVGGSGTADVITLRAAVTTPTVTGFETVVAGNAVAIDLTNISGNTVLGVEAGIGAGTNAGIVSFTNAAATQNTLAFSGKYNADRTLDLAATYAAGLNSGGTVGYTLKTQTTADTLNVTFDNGGVATSTAGATSTYTVGTVSTPAVLTATNVENINISTADFKAVTLGGINNGTGTGAVTVTATGAANLTLGTLTITAPATSTDTYTFSGNTGTVSATLADTGTLNYTGSNAADTVTTAATVSTKTQTINAGTGDNNITFGQLNNNTAATAATLVVTGGAGVDTFNTSIGATVASIAGATTGSVGVAGVVGATALNTIKLDGSTGTADVLNVTLVTANAAALTLNDFKGVEIINVLGTAVNTITGDVINLGVTAGYAESVTINQLSTVGTNAGVLANFALSTAGILNLANVKFQGAAGIGTSLTTAGASGLKATGSVNNDTITGSTTSSTIIDGGTGVDSLVLGTHASFDTVILSAVITAADRDTITGFVSNTDKVVLGLGNTTVATAAGAAVVTADTTVAGVGGGAYALTGATTANADVILLHTTGAMTATGVNSGDLSAATDGTELLKAMTTAAAADTYTGITTAAASQKVYLVASQGTSTYVYYAVDTSADSLITASEIALVGTFTSTAAMVAADFILA